MTQLLEDHLTTLFKLASKWGQLGFATLLKRATNALTELDLSVFHNASSKDMQYINRTECLPMKLKKYLGIELA